MTPCFVQGEGFLHTMIVPGEGFCPLRVVSRGAWFWMKLIAALYNWSTLLSEMYDDFLAARNHGKLSANFLKGISMVIEKVGPFSYILFLARTTIGIRRNNTGFFQALPGKV